MRSLARILIAVMLVCVSAPQCFGGQLSLWDIHRVLSTKRFVDLTHAFHPEIPHWKGFPAERRREIYTYEKEGFRAEEFTHVGQWGTHVDPPAHFHKGLLTIDEIPLDQMILPLVLIDVHEKAATNPDYVLSVDDVTDWESTNGRIPKGAFVAMRTDWSKRWPDADAMSNKDDDGISHYPGWSVEALQFLVEKRKIAAVGHETTDTDPGIQTSKDDYSAESYVLGQNHYQVELMANLDQVPEKGALIVCAFPKPLKGSGFPARVFAILP